MGRDEQSLGARRVSVKVLTWKWECLKCGMSGTLRLHSSQSVESAARLDHYERTIVDGKEACDGWKDWRLFDVRRLVNGKPVRRFLE